MSQPDYENNPEAMATLSCHKGPKKTEECSCPPCTARREVYGRNIPFVHQKRIRFSRHWKLFQKLRQQSKERSP